MKKAFAVALVASALLTGCSAVTAYTAPAGASAPVTAQRIMQPSGEEWVSHGRSYDEQRHSPLAQITRDNVRNLGLAWAADLDTARGQEATPLVIDGKIFITTAWSKVKAFDAATGAPLWDYDPQVPGEAAVKACCDVVNRGLAAWGDKLFFGTLDGRLIALDRNTGQVAWSKVTVDQSQPYTITGAPRVIDGKVIIGNGGGEMGVRGYITAYDASNGDQLWRFYTVPDQPGRNASTPHLQAAEGSWKGEYWNIGGGGTVWDSMAYDPALDLLYIGVGNGSPWNQAIRSPGGGDNLYLSSIVAIRPKTGEYVWHFQTTPGETWDYTATQHMILADMMVDGTRRKVIMQAPKNGFFFMLDRTDGKLISAKNYVPVNWATGFDMATGRPIENPAARYDKTGQPYLVSPGPYGAHNWQPMAYNPDEGLVYIPAINSVFPYVPKADYKPNKLGFNTGVEFAAAALPPDPAIRAMAVGGTTGELIAWDPVAQAPRWSVKSAGAWNGGLLSTAGGLVFQGNAAGEVNAFAANDGTKLWSFGAQTGVVAPPITYSINNEQYVAVLAGWGGAFPLAAGIVAQPRPIRNISRLLVFKLGAQGALPALEDMADTPLDPPASTGTPEQLALGGLLFSNQCAVCHGNSAIGNSITRDLRRAGSLTDASLWKQIVIDGILKDAGMVGFGVQLTPEQSEAMRLYVIHRANEDKALGDS